MHTYIHTYMHACIYTYTQYPYMYTHTYILHAHIHLYTHAFTSSHTHTQRIAHARSHLRCFYTLFQRKQLLLSLESLVGSPYNTIRAYSVVVGYLALLPISVNTFLLSVQHNKRTYTHTMHAVCTIHTLAHTHNMQVHTYTHYL